MPRAEPGPVPSAPRHPAHRPARGGSSHGPAPPLRVQLGRIGFPLAPRRTLLTAADPVGLGIGRVPRRLLPPRGLFPHPRYPAATPERSQSCPVVTSPT